MKTAKPNTQERSTRVPASTRIICAAADSSAGEYHSNPFVSGLLGKIALLPSDTVAAAAALVRLSLRDDELGRIARETVFEAETGLLESDPAKYSHGVYFWNGIVNGLEILGSLSNTKEADEHTQEAA